MAQPCALHSAELSGQRGAGQHSEAKCSAVKHSAPQRTTAQFSAVQRTVAQRSLAGGSVAHRCAWRSAQCMA
eukprot:4786257-Alexandrium_andersonii.AAC.1